MHDLYLQWLTDPAAGWEKHAVSDWASLPKRDEGSAIDGEKGTLALICIAGQEFGQDSIALQVRDDGKLTMTGWSKNAIGDPGLPIAKVHVLGEETITTVREYDPKPGTHVKETMVGPHHELTIYVDEQHWPVKPKFCITGEVAFRPYTEFVPPPEEFTRYTAVVSDELWAAHQEFKNPTP